MNEQAQVLQQLLAQLQVANNLNSSNSSPFEAYPTIWTWSQTAQNTPYEKEDPRSVERADHNEMILQKTTLDAKELKDNDPSIDDDTVINVLIGNVEKIPSSTNSIVFDDNI